MVRCRLPALAGILLCSNYKVVCNQVQCSCTDGVTIKVCGPAAGITCPDCQAVFNGGCCQGL